jgi:hypothetical protein
MDPIHKLWKREEKGEGKHNKKDRGNTRMMHHPAPHRLRIQTLVIID